MSLRDIERGSIRNFVQSCADEGLLQGRVLDYGAGKKPYRGIVEHAGASYTPYDRMGFPASVADSDLGPPDPLSQPLLWDAILCTQVIQYHRNVSRLLHDFHWALRDGGWLVMTGPTNWPTVEKEDILRLTSTGVGEMLTRSRFKDVRVRARAHVEFEGERWCLGWQAVARA